MNIFLVHISISENDIFEPLYETVLFIIIFLQFSITEKTCKK